MSERRSKATRTIEVHEGSGNVYADLGYPDAEEMLVKAKLTVDRRRADLPDPGAGGQLPGRRDLRRFQAHRFGRGRQASEAAGNGSLPLPQGGMRQPARPAHL